MKTFNTVAAQEPQNYLDMLNHSANAALQSMNPAPAAPAHQPSSAQAIQTAFMNFQSQANSIIYKAQLELEMTRRDKVTLAADLERETELREKAQSELQGFVNTMTEERKEHVRVLSEATQAAERAKTDAEAAAKEKDDRIKELEDQLAAASKERDEANDALQKAETAKNDAEDRARKLGAKVAGLPDVTAAADQEGQEQEGQAVSTEQGDPVAPTQTMTAQGIAAVIRTGNQEDAEAIELLREFTEKLSLSERKGGHYTREYLQFLNGPKKEKIQAAIRRREELLGK